MTVALHVTVQHILTSFYINFDRLRSSESIADAGISRKNDKFYLFNLLTNSLNR